MRRFLINLLFPLAQSRVFWKMRDFGRRSSFHYARFIFYRRERLRNSVEDISLFLSILKRVAVYTVILALVLAGIEVAERFIVSHVWALEILKFQSDKSYSSTDYTLQALTGIQGIFLALYFTAVSVAASAMYAEVPHEVRLLLARDRMGGFFLRFIAACTAVDVLLLGYRGLGGNSGKGVLLACVILGCYSIFAMLVVLKNSITLFDPARVGRIIFRDLTQAFRSASIEGFAWKNKSFQHNYSNQAENSLKTLGMVVDICARKPGLGNQPLSDLMMDTLRTWAVYAYYRGRIPFESEWYRSVYRHKQWLLARDHEIALALNTQTTLQPEKRKNRNWLEADLLPVVERGLQALLDRGDVAGAHRGVVGMAELARGLANQLDTSNLAQFQAIAKSLVDRWSTSSAKNELPDAIRDEREEIGLSDLLGMIPINVALGIGDWAEAFDFDVLHKRVTETNWSSKKAAYRCGLPYGALELLEELQEKLAFEMLVEGKRISPDWYVEEIILLGIMKSLKPCLDEIQIIVGTHLIKNPTQLFDAKRYRSSTALALRGLEFIDKYSTSLWRVRKVVDEVENRSKIKDLSWPKFDFNAIMESLHVAKNGLIKLLGQSVPIHSLIPDDASLPDFFGASYVYVLEETFFALIRDEEAAFKELFPSAFQGGMAAFDRLQEHIAGLYPQSAITLRADVLIDILEIGSYAKFFSEYRGNPAYWKVCTDTWDNYFSHRATPAEAIDYIVGLARFKENQFGISPRGTYRYNWRHVLNTYLEQQGNIVEITYFSRRNRSRTDSHASKLVREICSTHGMGIEWPGPDIFLIAYFENHRKSASPLDIRDRYEVREMLTEGAVDDDGIAGEFDDFVE